MRERRVAAYRRGLTAETLAAFWLRLKGMRIVGRRVKTPVGEIDLVALSGRTLVIVEVKARARRSDAIEALGPRQRARLARAAEAILARGRFPRVDAVRFDVVLFAGWACPEHLVDAWRPDGAHGP